MTAPEKIPPSQTLTEIGQLANGVASNFAMLCMMQPAFAVKTYVMSGQGFPPVSAFYRGFGANCAAVLPAQGIAFLANGVAIKYLGDRPTDAQRFGSGLLAGAAGAPAAATFERVMIVQQLGKTKIPVRAAVVKIVTQDGLRGVAKGLFPNLLDNGTSSRLSDH